MKRRNTPLLASPEARGFNQQLVKDQVVFVAKNCAGELLPTVKVRLLADMLEVGNIKAFMYALDNPLQPLVDCATSQYDFVGLTYKEVKARIKNAEDGDAHLRKAINERISQLRTGRI